MPCDFASSKEIVVPNPLPEAPLVPRLSENVAIVARYELAAEEIDGNKVRACWKLMKETP